MADRAYLERMTRELTDQGKLIEAGWIGLRLTAIHPKASPDLLTEMRMAFFAGAQHLFGSVMSILEPGEDIEPTENDLKRMDLIHRELETFIEEFKLKHTTAKGSA
jgi:hypothetical protein